MSTSPGAERQASENESTAQANSPTSMQPAGAPKRDRSKKGKESSIEVDFSSNPGALADLLSFTRTVGIDASKYVVEAVAAKLNTDLTELRKSFARGGQQKK